MRLYPLSDDVSGVMDPESGELIKPGDDGGFELTDGLLDLLHSSGVRGKRQWETAIERQERMSAAKLRHEQSPEALYELVRQLVQAAAPPAPAKPAATKAASTKTGPASK